MNKLKIIAKSKIAWSAIILFLVGLEPFLTSFDGILPQGLSNALKIIVPLAIVYWRTTTKGVDNGQNQNADSN